MEHATSHQKKGLWIYSRSRRQAEDFSPIVAQNPPFHQLVVKAVVSGRMTSVALDGRRSLYWMKCEL